MMSLFGLIRFSALAIQHSCLAFLGLTIDSGVLLFFDESSFSGVERRTDAIKSLL